MTALDSLRATKASAPAPGSAPGSAPVSASAGSADALPEGVARTPASLVQAQLDAYNAHDVSALLRCYHPQAEQFEYPDRLLARGHEALRARMETRFATSRPVAVLLHRIVLGSMVIDHERIEQLSPQGLVVRELIGLFDVEPDERAGAPAAADAATDAHRAPRLLIRRARFIFGEERPA